MLLLYLIFLVRNCRLRICKQIALQMFGSNLRTNIFETNYLHNLSRPALIVISIVLNSSDDLSIICMYSSIECSVSIKS